MTHPPLTFRAGACAVIVGADGRVMAFERNQPPAGEWQFPQGGLEVGEDPEETVFREVEEETGIERGSLTVLTGEPRLLVYELPDEYRTPTLGRGQALYCFMFRFTGPEEAVTLGDRVEFRDWRWMPMEELVAQVIPFRRALYEELERWLGDVLG